MLLARAELRQHGIVPLRAVALVNGEAVLRILRVQHLHPAIPRHLREDRRRSNRGRQPVSFHDRPRRDAKPRIAVPIDERQLRLDAKLLDGAAHREERRLQNIDLVDLLMARERDAVGHGVLHYYII